MLNNLDKKLKDVIEFREMMGLPVGTGGYGEEKILNIATVSEEFIELANADNLIDKADALVDLAYTVIGMSANEYEFGVDSEYDIILELIHNASQSLGIDFDRCWDEVHRSNMSKACKNSKEVIATKAVYAEKGVSTYFEEVNGLVIVKCLNDTNGIMKKGKALKSAFYSEADLGFVGG